MKKNHREPRYLSRYLDVMRDKLPSQFLISQSVRTDFNKDSPLSELLKIHGAAMESFHRRMDEIRSLKDLPQRAESSLLDLKVAIADKILERCFFCERRCGVNRRKKELGYCRCDAVSHYSAEFMHYGEEPELVPSHTIFFTGCNFSCAYCQNWDISTAPTRGVSILPPEVARTITLRRTYDSRNVNFVTPTPHTHIILKILNSLKVNIPVVWNSNMYYSEEVAGLLEGAVDVYLGDFRYGNDECAEKYSDASDYMRVVTRNFRTAYLNGEILLRHLVLPGHIECCTGPIAEWVVKHIPEVRFNLMFQYRPEYRAYEYPEINRALTREERQEALLIVKEAGLEDVLI